MVARAPCHIYQGSESRFVLLSWPCFGKQQSEKENGFWGKFRTERETQGERTDKVEGRMPSRVLTGVVLRTQPERNPFSYRDGSEGVPQSTEKS